MADKTIWQEVIAEGVASFGGGDEPISSKKDNSDVVDSFGLDKQAQKWFDILHPKQPGSTGMPVGGDVTMEQDLSDMTPEDIASYNIFAPSVYEQRKAATQKVRDKFGDQFLHMDPETRRQAIEYETDEIIAAQYGGEPRRSVIGTIIHNVNKGFDKSFFQNIDTLSKAMWGGIGIGGEENRINPQTGKFSQFVSYDDLIPGFSDMSFDSRRQAITDLKNSDLYQQRVKLNADDEGFLAGASFLVGAMADPTTMTPLGAGYKNAAVLSGLVAGSDLAMYDYAEKGIVDPQRIGTAVTIGAVAGPALLLGTKAVSKKLNQRYQNNLVNKFEQDYARALAKGESKAIAEVYARFNNGNLTQGALDQLYTNTGRTRKLPETPATARAALEERLSYFHRYEWIGKAGQKIDNVVTPISDVIYRWSPKFANALRKHDMDTHLTQHKWFVEVAPFLKQKKKMSKTDQGLLENLTYQSNPDTWAEAYSILKRYERQDPTTFKGLVDNFDNVRKTLKEVGVLYKQHGFDINLIEHHFPRVAVDPKALSKVPNTFVSKHLEQVAKKKGRPLTDYEIGKEINKLLNFKVQPGGKVKTSGSLRDREIDTLHDWMMPHYADMEGALHSYLRMASMDINRAKLMQRFGYKGKFRTDGTDIESLLGETLHKEFKRLGSKPEEQNRVIELLQSRFTTGEMAPSHFWKNFKNLGYAYTIGNPLSAITQLGDQAFAMYKAGVLRAAKTAFTPKNMGDIPFIEKEILGLTDALEEIYSSPAKTKEFLDWTLEWGQFNRMDRFGKETIINGALRKHISSIKTEKGTREFIAKWGPYFEGETGQLISDLKKFGKTYQKKMRSGSKKGQLVEMYGGMTPNMKLLLWHELADVQPISLSEMPKFYLDHPKARVGYMLKTFTIKQLDFMRREIFRKYKEGHPVQATKNLAMFTSFWLLMNGSADKLKSIMTGDDFDVTDNMVDNMFQLAIFGRYSAEQAAKEGLWEAITEYVAPPAPYADLPFQILFGTSGKKPEDALELVPVVGRAVNKIRKNKEKEREELRRGMTLAP